MNASVSTSLLAAHESFAPSGVETSKNAIAATARASVESRYVMAMRNRRNWDTVRQELLTACRNPYFANSDRTYYVMPYDNKIHGLGIGFAEEAIRLMGNIYPQAHTVYDSMEFEIVRVTVTDLENNVPWEADVRVEKTIERAKPIDDGTPGGFFISKRRNSQNHWTYTLPAREDDLIDKRQSAVSKMTRVCALRHLPNWVKEECTDVIFSTRSDRAARDPSAERRLIIDSFDSIGVRVADLTAYVGHDLGVCSPAELVKLRAIFDAIRAGEATWAAYTTVRDEGSAAASPHHVESRQRAGASMSKSANASTAAPQQQSPQGAVNQSTGEIGEAATASPSPAPTPAPSPAPVASGPACSEGEIKFLLKKASASPGKLAPALVAVGYHGLNGIEPSEVEQIIATLDWQKLQGLNVEQFKAAKGKL